MVHLLKMVDLSKAMLNSQMVFVAKIHGDRKLKFVMFRVLISTWYFDGIDVKAIRVHWTYWKIEIQSN